MNSKPPSILIAGLGNLLLSDDGVGIHAIRELADLSLEGVVIADIGTAIFHAVHYLETADRVLLIDAVKAGGAPGTLYMLDAEDVCEDGPAASIHTLGMRSLARLMPDPSLCPPMTVLGVEPESLDYGEELSDPVRAALPEVINVAKNTVRSWMNPLLNDQLITKESVPC
jgi:hydrogenase maturation protease